MYPAQRSKMITYLVLVSCRLAEYEDLLKKPVSSGRGGIKMRKNLISAAFAAAATMMILGINGFCAETDEFQAPEAELVSVEVVEAPVCVDYLPVQEEVAAPVEEVAAEEVSADVDYICADAEMTAPVEEIEAVIEEVPAAPAEEVPAEVVETPAEEVTETPIEEAPVVTETPVITETPATEEQAPVLVAPSVAPVVEAAPAEVVETPAEVVAPAEQTPVEETPVVETPATEVAPETTPVLPSVGSAVVIKGEKTNGSIEVSDEDEFVEEPEEPTPVVPQPEEPKPVEPQPEEPQPEVPSTPVVEEPQPETPSTPVVEESVEEEIVTAPEEVTILPAPAEEKPEVEMVSAPSTGRYLMTGDDDVTMNVSGLIALASLMLLCGYAVAKSAQKKYARA